MNKESRDILIRLKFKDEESGKVYDLEKRETLEIEYGKETKKTVTFKLDDRKQNFIIEIKPTKGWFGDRVGVISVGGEFIHEKQPTVVMLKDSIKFKNNPWRTQGKVLAGGLVAIIFGGLIGFVFWRRRKSKT